MMKSKHFWLNQLIKEQTKVRQTHQALCQKRNCSETLTFDPVSVLKCTVKDTKFGKDISEQFHI